MSDVHAYKPASRELPVPIGMNIAHWFALTTARLIVKSACQWNCVGSENIPLEGGIIIAVNHQSFLDPPLVALASPRQDIVYLAKSEIMAWPILGRLFPQLHVIPVDQQNADRTALRHLINIVRTGHVAVIFPEGGRTPDGEKSIYEYAKTKQLFEVPVGELSPQFFLQVQEQLSVLVGAPKEKVPAVAEIVAG